MCLVAFSWKNHPEYPLIISTNRDEFFNRPSEKLHLWERGFYAGKDLRSGGTWMGIHRNGRWSLLTNYRDFANPRQAKISRGKLVQTWLESTISADEYLKEIQESQDHYDGFNLLVSEGDKLFYLSNYSPDILELSPGIYGLSNALLDDPWPKVELAKSQLEHLIQDDFSISDLLSILKSKETFPQEMLPQTGATPEMESSLSAQLIRMSGNYGTVSATALVQDKSGLVLLKQRSYHWNPAQFSDLDFQFQIQQT
tara:strand:- start:626 stop:1390 length:765 start_codon:yes stop_codon:yes gene_type:complete